MVEGANSVAQDVIISLEGMNSIESVDKLEGVAVVQAGAVLQVVQETLADQQLLFPLDLGARGSCTIGGTIATNAGGINVLRYGMMRQLVLGLEAVLMDGTVISSMNTMLKNNTGYDLKQLFIGSEGTLGIVTKAVIRLFPLPTSTQTAFVAINSFDQVVELLKLLQSQLAGTLSAYEVMWNSYYHAVTGEGAHRAPLARDYPFYVLVEAEGFESDADEMRFSGILEAAMLAELIVDAVVPQSEKERKAVWDIREEFDPVLPAYLYDVSLPIKHMDAYVQALGAQFGEQWPEAMCVVFGHMADGNLHIFVSPEEGASRHAFCDAIVYGCLDGFDGCVSAEHGIGLEKTDWLSLTRSADEIALMQSLKQLVDSKGLLNPGKVLATT